MNKISFTLDVDKEIKAGTLTVGKMDARKCRIKKYSAKEMFEELGFHLDIETNEEQIVYSRDILDSNTFGYLDSEIISFEKDDEVIYFTNKYYLTKSEVEAIQQQIKELGWR